MSRTRRSHTRAVAVIFVALATSVIWGLMAGGGVPRALAAFCGPAQVPPTPTPEPSMGPPPCEQPLDADGSDHAAGTVTAGGRVSTDYAFDGATADDPVETIVYVPNDASVAIDEINPTLSPPSGYMLIGQQVNVVTPDAAPPSRNPIAIDLYLDTVLWPGVDPSAISLVHDGLIVPPCDNRSVIASPDPCVLVPPLIGGSDDREFYVWTTSAGSWLFVEPTPASEVIVGAPVAAGGSVTTDPEHDGASFADPVETTVVTPVAGSISISEGAATSAPPAGFTFAGQEIVIEAPTASASQPLALTFALDPSILAGQDSSTVQIFRDGAPVAACSTSDGSASPDPCVSARATLNGDAVITVLTSHASHWNMAIHARFPFTGFFQPVDGGNVLNAMQAGAAVPVKFSLGRDEGLLIMASGSPSSRPVVCATGAQIDSVETTTTATTSGLRFDAGAGQYIYVWKTDKGWAGTCRRLTIRLIDGSPHTSDFSFKK